MYSRSRSNTKWLVTGWLIPSSISFLFNEIQILQMVHLYYVLLFLVQIILWCNNKQYQKEIYFLSHIRKTTREIKSYSTKYNGCWSEINIMNTTVFKCPCMIDDTLVPCSLYVSWRKLKNREHTKLSIPTVVHTYILVLCYDTKVVIINNIQSI